MKPFKIHFHSDLEYFGGSERLMPILWRDTRFSELCSMSFSYFESHEYSRVVTKLLPGSIAIYPLSATSLDKLLRSASHLTSQNRLDPRRKANWLLALRRAVVGGCWLILLYPTFLANVLRLWLLLVRVRPDAIHLNNGGYPGALSVRAGAVAAKLAGVQFVVMVVNNIAQPYRRPSRVIEFPLDLMVRACVDQYVCSSEVAASALRKTLRLSVGAVRVIANACLSCTEPSIADRSDPLPLRDEGKIVVGVIAQFEYRKGHAFLVEALEILFHSVDQMDRPLEVRMIGSGSLEAQFRDQVRQFSWWEIVKFYGYREDYLEFMKDFDFLIIPSISDEDLPLVMIEAMSIQVPIIATRVGGLSEHISDEETGLLVHPEDCGALANAIHRMATDASFRHFIAANAKKYSEQTFSGQNFVDNYLSLYRVRNGDDTIQR